MTTRIDHKIKHELGISILEYCVLDCFRLNPKRSLHATAKTLQEDYSDVEAAVQSLCQKGLLVHDSQTKEIKIVNSFVPAPVARTRPVTINGEKQYSLDYKLKLRILELNPDYQWNGIDAKHLKLLIAKLRSSFHGRHDRDGNDEEIIGSFLLLVSCIPHLGIRFWINWDIKLLNSEYNKIIAAIKKPENKGKFRASIDAINEASNNMLDSGRIKTARDYGEQ